MVRCVSSDDGFNLVELMAIVAIIGILLSVAIASYSVSTGTAARIACAENRREFQQATQRYASDNTGQPSTMGDLAPYVKNYAQAIRCPADPSVHLTLDPGTLDVSCPTHGR